MLYYCSHTCRSIICPPFFGNLYWGMLIYFISWNLVDVANSYLTCYVGCTLTKRLEKKLDSNSTRMLRVILNKSWRQHPTRHQLYGHQPPITKTIQVRRNRHAGDCWRSRDELISDVLLGTPTYKSRMTSSNIHTAAMWGYGMEPWRPAGGDER